MKNKIKWISSDIELPPENKPLLVFFDNSWHGIGVKHYIPPRGDYCYGWYPGGRTTKGTFWAILPEPPKGILNGK